MSSSKNFKSVKEDSQLNNPGRKIALVVEYEGTRYKGSQSQPNRPTIQGTLDEALKKLTGESIKTIAAGRTDTGVHARGQVVSFGTSATITPEAFRSAVNHLLPGDIRVVSAHEMPAVFDARRSASSRVYEYEVWNAPDMSAFQNAFAYHVPRQLDVQAMTDAADAFVGKHDFKPFSGSLYGSESRTTTRTITMFSVRKVGQRIVFTVEANAFLPHQVRRMVGALLEVGSGRKTKRDIEDTLKNGRLGSAQRIVPPNGLYLSKVKYNGFKLKRKSVRNEYNSKKLYSQTN